MSDRHVSEVIILPCSGIGRAFGSVGREAAYVVTEGLCAGRVPPKAEVMTLIANVLTAEAAS